MRKTNTLTTPKMMTKMVVAVLAFDEASLSLSSRSLQ